MRFARLLVVIAACGDRHAASVDGGQPLDANATDATSHDAPGDAGVPINVHSGTRLKAEWDVFADGTRQSLQTIWDSALGVDCDLVETTGGGLVCLPTTAIGNSIVYLDSGCSQPVVRAVAGSGVMYAPSSTFEPQCQYSSVQPSPTNAVYALGSALAATGTWAFDAGGDCAFEGPPPAGEQLYALGSNVLASFATLTPSSPEGSGAFPMIYATSADGFSAPLAFFDAVNQVACAPTNVGWFDYPASGAAAVTCQPTSYGASSLGLGLNYFAGSSCEPAAASVVTGCPIPSVFELALDCDWIGSYYATKGSAALVYEGNANSCSLVDPDPTQTFEALGSAFVLGQLPRTAVSVVGHRMSNVFVNTLPVTYPSVVYDNELALECTSRVAPDGMVRCLPTTTAVVDTRTWFSDADCKTALQLVTSFRESPLCTSTPAPTYAVGSDAIYLVGSAYTGGMYYLSGSDCAMDTDDRSPYYATGAMVPTTTFAPATLTIDP